MASRTGFTALPQLVEVFFGQVVNLGVPVLSGAGPDRLVQFGRLPTRNAYEGVQRCIAFDAWIKRTAYLVP